MWKFVPGESDEGGWFYGPNFRIFVFKIDYVIQDDQITFVTVYDTSTTVVLHVLDGKILIHVGPTNFVINYDSSFQSETTKMINSGGIETTKIQIHSYQDSYDRIIMKMIEDQQ